MNLKTHFTETYKFNTWESSETKSGPGSEINSPFVKETKDFLTFVVNTYITSETLSISDIPCGDFNFINNLFEDIFEFTNIKQINYYAYDIVDNILSDFDKLKKLENVNYYFKVLDITKEIPIKTDIVLCKELFIHLSFEDINRCFLNFKKSKSTFLIVNNFYNGENVDINYTSLGECRPVYLLEPPLNFPEPKLIKGNYCLFKLCIHFLL